MLQTVIQEQKIQEGMNSKRVQNVKVINDFIVILFCHAVSTLLKSLAGH